MLYLIIFSAINGFAFGTLPGLEMCIGEKVTWHMYGLGERFDHHHFTFESNNFRHDGRQVDAGSVFPGVGTSVKMIPDQAGCVLLSVTPFRCLTLLCTWNFLILVHVF